MPTSKTRKKSPNRPANERYTRPLSGRVLDLAAMHNARNPRRFQDPRNEDVESQMERNGRAIIGRDLDLLAAPPVVYTAGMTAVGHPEFLLDAIAGLDARLAFHLHQLCDDVLDGVEFQHGDVIEGLYANGYRAMLLEMDDPFDLEYPVWVYGSDRVRAFQVVIPDSLGRWPWEPEASALTFPMLPRFRRNGLPRHLTGTRMPGFADAA